MFKLGLRSLDDPRRGEFPKMMVDEAQKALLPPAFNYTSTFPKPDDQGQFGTCVAFGNRKVFEYWYKKITGHDILISPRALFSAIKQAFYPNDTTDDGAQVSDAIKILEQWYALEQDMPYSGHGSFDQFLHGVPDNIKHTDFVYKNFVAVNPDVDSLKYALVNHGPVVLGMAFAEEWYRCNPLGQLQGSNLTMIGGHCMSVIGYDDNFVNLDGSKGAFLIINNWSQAWAANGYCWLPYNVDKQFFPNDLFTVAA